MLSVAKLALGQEAYYEQQVALGLDDYYAGRGESPGLWAGSGADGLGLHGVVEDGHLGTLLRGVSPADGVRLRAPATERTITVRILDEATGVWSDEPKTLAPVAGYDLVFSCPKSVSLLHALTDDEDVRRAISDAHEASWQAALSYLESEACVIRRGRGGAIREHGEGFVAAVFRHRTSRAQDPHLHTHVIVANQARSADGTWRALDGEAILRTHRLAAGYLYEAHLRGELSRTLGVRWTEPVKGMAEIEGVPTEALRAFSTRRQSLLEHMEAMGTSGFAASRVAALATRERKERVDLPDLRETWLERASEMGFGADELRGLLAREPVREVEFPTIAADDLTAHQATVTTPEIVRAVAGAARDGVGVEAVLADVARIVRGPEVTQVGDDATPGRPARFTTRSLLDLEREALEIGLGGREAGAPRAGNAQVMSALADAPVRLSEEQRTLVATAALTSDRVVCVVGVAGAGKTTALRVLGDALERSGVRVLGAAPSGRAADELREATEIPARTLHSLLGEARRSVDRARTTASGIPGSGALAQSWRYPSSTSASVSTEAVSRRARRSSRIMTRTYDEPSRIRRRSNTARSGRGAHQLASPSRSIALGTSSSLMTNASTSTASANPSPSSRTTLIPEVPMARNTTATSTAAAPTTGAVRETPSTTARVVSPWRSYSSRTRESRNNW
jgi:conjugative relaxase-like TrwC/TraI family protein